jgi:hypothetical protein
LPNSSDGRLVQERYRAQNANVFDASLTVYDRFENDDSLYLRSHCKQWVVRFDAFNQRWSFQLTTHAHGLSSHRSWRRWRWRRRWGQITEDSTYNTTNHAPRNPSLNSTRNPFGTAGVNLRFLDDLSRGLDRRSLWVYSRHWLDRLRLRRR